MKVGRAGASTDMRQGGGVTGGVVTQATTTTSRQRDKRSQLALEIVLRNFANRPDQAKVDWTFFCERVDENSYRVDAGAKAAGSLHILSQGAQDLAFKPGGTEKVVAESAAAIMHESRSSSVSNVRSGGVNQTVVSNGVVKTGYKLVGWFTRVTADGQVLGVKASSPRFETMARNEAVLAALPKVSEQAPTWAPPPSK